MGLCGQRHFPAGEVRKVDDDDDDDDNNTQTEKLQQIGQI